MAKPNYSFQKRQRELAKKKKKEERQQEKNQRKAGNVPAPDDAMGDTSEAEPASAASDDTAGTN